MSVTLLWANSFKFHFHQLGYQAQFQAQFHPLSPVIYHLISLNCGRSRSNIWWEENNANIAGVVATEVDTSTAAVVEVVGGAEDSGAKMMRRYTKEMPISHSTTCLFVRPTLLAHHEAS